MKKAIIGKSIKSETGEIYTVLDAALASSPVNDWWEFLCVDENKYLREISLKTPEGSLHKANFRIVETNEIFVNESVVGVKVKRFDKIYTILGASLTSSETAYWWELLLSDESGILTQTNLLHNSLKVQTF